jgi:hypothetical protein
MLRGNDAPSGEETTVQKRTAIVAAALAGAFASGGCFQRLELAMPGFDRPVLMNDRLLEVSPGGAATVSEVMPFTCTVEHFAHWLGDTDTVEIYEDYVQANVMPALGAVASAGPNTYVKNAYADASAWTGFLFFYWGERTRITVNGQTAALNAPPVHVGGGAQ